MVRVSRFAQLARQQTALSFGVRPIASLGAFGRTRCYSTEQTPEPIAQNSPNPRWLSELQGRVDRLLAKNLQAKEAQEAGNISGYVKENWLELLAGREGYLTGKEWRGLDRQAVVWGDMVSSRDIDGLSSL